MNWSIIIRFFFTGQFIPEQTLKPLYLFPTSHFGKIAQFYYPFREIFQVFLCHFIIKRIVRVNISLLQQLKQRSSPLVVQGKIVLKRQSGLRVYNKCIWDKEECCYSRRNASTQPLNNSTPQQLNTVNILCSLIIPLRANYHNCSKKNLTHWPPDNILLYLSKAVLSGKDLKVRFLQ
jgi:hypothetical protein